MRTRGDAMPEKSAAAIELHNPVAIFEKELLNATAFTLRTFELCTLCGARFGIGYTGACESDARIADDLEELPKKLTEILARDHWHSRAHKHFIDLDT